MPASRASVYASHARSSELPPDAAAALGPSIPASALPSMIEFMTDAFNASDHRIHHLCVQSMCFMIQAALGKEMLIRLRPPAIVQELPTRWPQFMNALVNFAFRYRTVESLEKMKANFSQCRCVMVGPFKKMHHDKPDFDELWEELTSVVFGVLTVVLTKIHLSKLSKLADSISSIKNKDEGYKAWAIHLVQKPNLVIDASVAWYTKFQTISIIEFLATSDSPAHAVTTSLLFSQPKTLFTLLDSVMARIMRTMLEVIRARKMDTTGFGTEREIFEHCRLVNTVFISAIPPSHVPASLLKKSYHTLCSMLHKLIEQDLDAFADGGRIEDMARTYLAGAAKEIFSLLSERNRGILGEEMDEVVGYYVYKTKVEVNTHTCGYLQSGMVNLYQERRCMNLECKRMPPESQKGYAQCGRCKIFCYCSSTCQTTAWTSPPFPHRSYCKDLGTLHRVWGSTLDDTMRKLHSHPALVGFKGNHDEQLEKVAGAEGLGRERLDEILDTLIAYDKVLEKA